MKTLEKLAQIQSESGEAKAPRSVSSTNPVGNAKNNLNEPVKPKVMEKALVPYHMPDPPKPAGTAIVRDAKGHPLKGQVLNPTGRPKGIPAYIHYMTAGGRELIDHALKTMRGEITITETKIDAMGRVWEIETPPSHSDRRAARQELEDRYLGKAPQQVDVNHSLAAKEFDYGKYTVEELLLLRDLAAKGQPEIVEGELVPDSDSPGEE